MDDTLHYLIMANQMLVQKSLLEQLKDTGLTIGQPKILDYLKDHDGSNQKEIARACFLEAGSLTTILNKMEEKGLIERRILNGNRRSFHIYLTAEGKGKQKLVEKAFAEIEKKHWQMSRKRSWSSLCLSTTEFMTIYPVFSKTDRKMIHLRRKKEQANHE